MHVDVGSILAKWRTSKVAIFLLTRPHEAHQQVLMFSIQNEKQCFPVGPKQMRLSIIADHIDHACLQNHGFSVEMFQDYLPLQNMNDVTFDTPMVSFITRAVTGQTDPDIPFKHLSDGHLAFFAGKDRFGVIFPSERQGFSKLDVHQDQIVGSGRTGVVSSTWCPSGSCKYSE